jgi:transposase InsO family protein
MQYYEAHGRNARLTCRHFDISPQTFYRWWRRFERDGSVALEARSRRPHRRRQPSWSAAVEAVVLKLRRQYPRWGKDKLVILLRREGHAISTSMVGRILRRLRQRGVLVEPARRSISAAKRRLARPYAIRKPREYQPRAPGDLVEVDTLDVRPLPGTVLKHFTGRDVISRWDVLEVHERATAKTAASFLTTLEARMPFPIRAIQIDGGSEFQAEFELACQQRSIRLFALPPRSPKLNGAVERAQRTHTEEFYEVYELPWTATALNQHARQWEHTYNTVRPHQALGYLTPAEFLAHHARCDSG